MSCTVDFLFYTGYINNSDQIADTREACDRGRCRGSSLFYVQKNILKKSSKGIFNIEASS